MSPGQLLAATVVTAVIGANASAQTKAIATLDADERGQVIDRTAEMLAERYVFQDVAEACGEHIRAQLEAGEYDGVTDPDAFARMLTESLQSVSHDKHMRVRLRAPAHVKVEQANPARAQARYLESMRRKNFGFQKVERLDGNVGYLDMRFFSGAPQARATAAAAMNFLANSDALIFDMRKNGGGNPEMIRFICSYLFDEPTHLNSLYWRQGDRTEEFWTTVDVPGPLMADVPVFVLTSSRTFSGAEEFSYNLQTRNRATLVGETTGGGANPGGLMPVNERFEIFIPTGRAINPVTGTNWEGVGVVPHVAVSADDAYDKALALAREAAESYRGEKDAATESSWAALGTAQDKAQSLIEEGEQQAADRVMANALGDARTAGLLGEMDINLLGYQLMGREQLGLAIAVLKYNVDAFPESFNAYDSLGEAYMNDDQIELAIRFYRKSLEFDPSNTNAQHMIDRMQADAD